MTLRALLQAFLMLVLLLGLVALCAALLVRV